MGKMEGSTPLHACLQDSPGRSNTACWPAACGMATSELEEAFCPQRTPDYYRMEDSTPLHAGLQHRTTLELEEAFCPAEVDLCTTKAILRTHSTMATVHDFVCLGS